MFQQFHKPMLLKSTTFKTFMLPYRAWPPYENHPLCESTNNWLKNNEKSNA